MQPHASFEIFRQIPDGQPAWLESCPSLAAAIGRARELAAGEPGNYFIFDRDGQIFIDACRESAVKSHTRVLVADDHPVTRNGICQTLRTLTNVEIVGEAADGIEAVEKTRALQPDLVIMDLAMPGLDGLSAAQAIKGLSPATAVLMFSMYAGKLFTDLAEKVGLNGFVAKEDGSPALLRAIDAVIHNQNYFPS